MWIYVLLGNVLRGIGETPVQPLGISYIDDFATEENAALYVGTEPSVGGIHLEVSQHQGVFCTTPLIKHERGEPLLLETSGK